MIKQLTELQHATIHSTKSRLTRSLYNCYSPDEIILLLLVRATHIWCCSSRTSSSWWTAHSAQRQRRGCNSTKKHYQRK